MLPPENPNLKSNYKIYILASQSNDLYQDSMLSSTP
jgi:hypothetical protein